MSADTLLRADERAAALLAERLEPRCLSARTENGMQVVTVAREGLIEALRLLRDTEGLGFRVLVDLTAVDWLTTGRTPRFDVVYQFLSRSEVARLSLVVPLEESDPVAPTAVEVFPAANWLEREVWDLMGISFLGHPDLRRIQLPEDYDGHPLRRDFPVRGGKRQVRREEEPAPTFGHRSRVR